jgi:pyruvate-formate lyase-activating enzyme
MNPVSTLDLYRLPWSLNDNVLSWLEPTKRCNLYCEGCYSRNDPKSDRPLEAVRADLDTFIRLRKTDSISIAGGDPLVYPHIVELVSLIRRDYGLKPIINTNGLALDPTLLRRLKDAGLYGFTFHIDSSQGRPGWKDADEIKLNELRLKYARMVHDAGDLSVAFNCTVFPHTLRHVPAVLDWARDHIDVVHSMVFILFRTMRTSEFQYFANGTPVRSPDVVYHDQDQNPEPLVAQDVLDEIWKTDPAFRPSAYLGGTKDPKAVKWLLTGRIGTPGRVYGYVGPRMMEATQTAHHAVAGRWLGYVKPSMLGHGRSMMLGLSTIDAGVRDAARAYAADLVRNPTGLLKRQFFQSVLIIQPIDMMPDGEMSMCDGCPDMTVHDGNLVWSCRLDERVQHGCFLTAAPRVA